VLLLFWYDEHMNSKQTQVTEGSLNDIKEEYRAIHRQYLVVLGIALALIVLGAFAYRQMLHLSWIDAFYFCTVTLATVGYGDITPTTDISKLFTIFYILIGIGVFAAFASLLVRNATLRRELRRAKRRQR
jgi:voltage-gated potassium channel